MTNEEVIISFLNGDSGHSLNLYTDGQNLVNYKTRIAYKKEKMLFLNKTKYSRTTSKIQNKLEQIAKDYYYEERQIFNYKEEN